jgi:hypothetical protein
MDEPPSYIRPVTIKNEGGAVRGTKIIADDGTDLCSDMAVESISISMPSVNDMVRATITVALVQTEVDVGKSDWVTKNPRSGLYEKISSISFADGARIVFDDDGAMRCYPDGGIKRVNQISDGRTYKFKSVAN